MRPSESRRHVSSWQYRLQAGFVLAYARTWLKPVLRTPQRQHDAASGPELLPLPPYCLLVRRAGAQEDAALPLALERVAHAHPHAADFLQFDLAEFAVLERAKALMVGATGDDIARVQGHDHAGELDQLGHAVFHVIGDVIMIQV